jgi:hypothetical protein
MSREDASAMWLAPETELNSHNYRQSVVAGVSSYMRKLVKFLDHKRGTLPV